MRSNEGQDGIENWARSVRNSAFERMTTNYRTEGRGKRKRDSVVTNRGNFSGISR